MARLPAVREYMDTEVFTVRPDMDILDAIDFLIAKHVTGAPVVDDGNKVIGIVTEKDCLAVLARGSRGEASTGRVSEYMVTNVVTIPPDMNIYYAAGLFLHHSFRRLPIVEDGRLIGAITRFDILKAVSANRKLVAEDD